MSDDFPDADERAARRAQLHTDLDAFLDTFIDDEGQGGYAKVKREHIEGLDGIVREIIDLKFQRDEDGDQVVLPRFDNRKRGRMVDVVIPHSPSDSCDTIAMAEWAAETASAISHITAIASEAGRILNSHLQQRATALKNDRLGEDMIKGAREHLAKGDIAAAEKLLRAIIGEPEQQHPVERKLAIRPRVLIEADDPRVVALRTEIAVRNPELEGVRVAVLKTLDEYERAAVTDRSIEHSVWEVIDAACKRFGRPVFQFELNRYNRIADERRRDRKKAQGK